MIGLYVGVYFADLNFIGIQKFNLQAYFGISKDITWQMGQAILSLAAVLVPIFIALCLITNSMKNGFENYLTARIEKRKLKNLEHNK